MKHNFAIIVFVIMTAMIGVAIFSCSRSASSETLAEVVSSAKPAILVDEATEPDVEDKLISAGKAKLAPALIDGKWINSDPLTLEDLRGRVALIEFWTFGCSNCINTLPAIKGFDKEYRDKGLTVIGIETPELDFERSFDGLVAAVKKREITYPVLTDYDSKNWNSFGVNAWPTIFIVDKQGKIRYKQVGEGNYEYQEKVIQTLLAEGANVVTTGSDEVFDGNRIVKTEAEWKKILTPDQFYIMREERTDYPFKSQFHDNHEKGEYYCAACHLKLFSSAHKFDSGTGWPSFYQPVNSKNVVEKEDRSLGGVRTEVECARCGAHLGHVFDDGPNPTGLRYCINGTSLKFEKAK